MKFTVFFCFIYATTSAYEVEVLRGPGAYELAESPHWDRDTQKLLFVDIVGQDVHTYVPSTGEWNSVHISDGPVSPVIPIADWSTGYIVGVSQSVRVMEWNGVSTVPSQLTTVHDLVTEAPLNAINDGKCDARGRLLFGTFDGMGQTSANFYRLDTDGHLSHLLSGIGSSNGLAWSPDNRTLYYIDSVTLHVEAFDYDIESGAISRRRSVFYLPDHGIYDGMMDGMTIDSDGNLWVALFGESKILHIDPIAESLLETIDLSQFASQVTALTFGGEGLETLFVTTAELGVSEPASGSLLAVRGLGVRGAGPGLPFFKNF